MNDNYNLAYIQKLLNLQFEAASHYNEGRIVKSLRTLTTLIYNLPPKHKKSLKKCTEDISNFTLKISKKTAWDGKIHFWGEDRKMRGDIVTSNGDDLYLEIVDKIGDEVTKEGGIFYFMEQLGRHWPSGGATSN